MNRVHDRAYALVGRPDRVGDNWLGRAEAASRVGDRHEAAAP